jgi:hypothetical protein
LFKTLERSEQIGASGTNRAANFEVGNAFALDEVVSGSTTNAEEVGDGVAAVK